MWKCLEAVRIKSPSKGPARLVLIMMANNAQENFVAWPSQDYLSNSCNMSHRAVQRCVSSLVKNGEISIVARSKCGINVYWLHPGGKDDYQPPDIDFLSLQCRQMENTKTDAIIDENLTSDMPDNGGGEHPTKVAGAQSNSTRRNWRLPHDETGGCHPTKVAGAPIYKDIKLNETLFNPRAQGNGTDENDKILQKKKIREASLEIFEICGWRDETNYGRIPKTTQLLHDWLAERGKIGFDAALKLILDYVFQTVEGYSGKITSPNFFNANGAISLMLRDNQPDPLAGLRQNERQELARLKSFLKVDKADAWFWPNPPKSKADAQSRIDILMKKAGVETGIETEIETETKAETGS